MKNIKIPDFDPKYWKNEALCIVWFFYILQNIHQTIKEYKKYLKIAKETVPFLS